MEGEVCLQRRSPVLQSIHLDSQPLMANGSYLRQGMTFRIVLLSCVGLAVLRVIVTPFGQSPKGKRHQHGEVPQGMMPYIMYL